MDKWVDLSNYSHLQQVLYFLDAVFWVIVYALVIRNIHKYKYVGIPAFSVMHNVAWEFVWSFIFVTELGQLFVWGIRLWFITDVILVYRLWQYGDKQLNYDFFKKSFHFWILIGIGGWIALFCGFLYQYADPIGATTGYVVNLIMSLLYIQLFFKDPSEPALTLDIAIFKMFGTAFVGVGVAIGKTSAPFVVVLAILTFMTDMVYCYLLIYRKNYIKS